jgi:hypothetical protein
MCGLVWYWNGSVKALFERMPFGLRFYASAKSVLKATAWVLLIFALYLSYYLVGYAATSALAQKQYKMAHSR